MSAPLDPQRWNKLTELFDRLVGLPAEERSARLRELCGDDEPLRAQAEAMLLEADVEGVLDRPAPEVLATWLEGIEAQAREETLGQRIGAYRLVEELGRGGMGVVYLAERADGQFEQEVALKLVKRGLDTDEVLARFRQERQILARLRHPAIARLFDGGVTEDGRPYFAMEHVAGQPITVYCEERRLSIEERLKLFQKVCEAVEHAHGQQVVHRDLKPSNILVTVDGELKLLDFGVAKLLGSGEGEQTTPALTRTGLRAMTPEYAAPEQVRGDPVSAATDVYALGVVLYELLTGRRPYELGSRFGMEAERMILEAEPARPSAVVQDGLGRRLAGDLDAIVLMALRKEPERRYASVQALADDVGRYLAGEPVTARPEGWTYRAGKLARRHRAALGIAALLCAVGAAGLLIQRGRSRATRREEARRYIATGMRLAGDGDALGALPWLTRAFELEPDADAIADHRLRIGTLLEHAPRLLRQWAHDRPTVAARFSPDGTRVLTATDDGSVRLWSVASGGALAAFRHGSRISVAGFSPDGRQVLTGGADGRVRLWNAAAGALERSLEGDAPVSYGEFSPDGRRLVVIGAGGTRLWDPTSGALVAAFPEADQSQANAVFDRLGRRFVTSGRKEARVHLADTGAPVGPALRNGGPVDWRGATLSADGSRVVTAPDGGRCATVWDTVTGRQAAELCRDSATVLDAFFDGTGRRAYMGGFPTLELWDLTQPPRRLASVDTGSRIWNMVVLGGGRYLLAATSDGGFVWDLALDRRIGPLRHAGGVGYMDLDPSARYVLTASQDGTARLWDLAGVEFASPAMPFPVSGRGGAVSRDGKRLLMVLGAYVKPTGGFQQLLETSTGEPVFPPLRHGGAIEYVGNLSRLFSPDERRILSGGTDHKVRVWSAESGEPLLTLSSESGIVDVTFSPDGRRIAGSRAGDDGRVELWDAVTGLSVGQITTPRTGPVTVAFPPDGARLATCGTATALWDAVTGRPLVQPWRAEGMGSFSGYDCRFSPDGRWLMTGGNGVRLWDALTAAPGTTFPGLGGVFSPRGDRLATMAGRSVVISMVATGKALTQPLGLEGSSYVTSVDFSSDGRWVVAAGEGVRVWDAATSTVLAVLDPRAWTAGGSLKGAIFLPATDGVYLGEVTLVEGRIARSRVWRFARDERPLADLAALSSLLAGYRVASDASGPVTLTGAELQRAWDHPGGPGARAAFVSKEKVLAWHRRLGDELAEEGHFAEALPHLDAAIGLGPPRATLFEQRGHARAEAGRLEEAETDFRTAAGLRPGFPDLWSHAAVLHASRGDAAGQRRICEDLLRESGATQNPDRAYWIARTCVLVPGATIADPERIVRLAEMALPLSGRGAEILDLQGAAFLRAGRYEESRERLLGAVKARGRVTPWEAAFLAMLHRRTRQPQEGRRWLKQGVGAAASAKAGDTQHAWTERLEAEALLAEARALLGGT